VFPMTATTAIAFISTAVGAPPFPRFFAERMG
jgi:hypothetical protein